LMIKNGTYGTLDGAYGIRPLEDRVLVELIEPPAVTPGGLALPDQSRERPQQGRVIAAGPGRIIDGISSNGGGIEWLSTNPLKTNDLVLIPPNAGNDVPDECGQPAGVKLKLIRADDILAVLDQ
jgi:chaperonin GroES